MSDTSLRVLMADDHPIVLAGLKALVQADPGLQIIGEARDGRTALRLALSQRPDVVVLDISMPEMTGIDFLKAVRAHDLDVPVILVTGNPGVDSAMQAMEYGAFRYLTKPVSGDHLWTAVSTAATFHKLARLKREALNLAGQAGQRLGDRAALEVKFSRGMSLLWMAFQPIVSWRARSIFGFEALLRSDEPLMKNPADMLDAAERLDCLPQLGRAVRAHVANRASDAPEGA